MREGLVTNINRKRAMVAIQTQDDGFTIIELLSDWDLQPGDHIQWANDYGLGSETYVNLTRNSREDVYVQNHGVSLASLRQQLLL